MPGTAHGQIRGKCLFTVPDTEYAEDAEDQKGAVAAAPFYYLLKSIISLCSSSKIEVCLGLVCAMMLPFRIE